MVDKKDWEKNYPLAKLLMDGMKSLKPSSEQKEEQPLTYEEWQLRKRREAGFMY